MVEPGDVVVHHTPGSLYIIMLTESDRKGLKSLTCFMLNYIFKTITIEFFEPLK